MILSMLVLGVLCALADRYSSHRTAGDPLPVTTAAWAAALAFVGFMSVGWAAVTFAMAWFAWRVLTPGAYAVTPSTRGFLGAFRHHLIGVGGCVAAAMVTHPSMLVTAVLMSCWAAAASAASVLHGQSMFADEHDNDGGLLLARGAAFGVCLAMVATA